MKKRIEKVMNMNALKKIVTPQIGDITGFSLDLSGNMLHFKGPKLIMSMPLDKCLQYFESEENENE